jgi:Tfp pilus assembly protein PilF
VFLLCLIKIDFLAYGNLANILSAQGKKKEAESAYKKALTYRFNMADVHYNL